MLVALAAMLAGCQSAGVVGFDGSQRGPARDFALRNAPAETPRTGRPAEAARTHVYLLRGLAQTVSEGVDHLSAKLNALGYVTSVHTYDDGARIVEMIAAEARASGGQSHAVVVGHSLGANSTVAVVNALAQRGLAADLAVTFDPTVENLVVRGGVKRFVNFYQSDNGWGKTLGAGAGQASRVENIDLKAMEHLTHFTIDRDGEVHNRVIAAIRQATGGSQTATRR
jgi:hypothetical protein